MDIVSLKTVLVRFLSLDVFCFLEELLPTTGHTEREAEEDEDYDCLGYK